MKVLCIKLTSGKTVRSMVPNKIIFPTKECIVGYMKEEIESVWLELGIHQEKISPVFYLGEFFTKELLIKARKDNIVIQEEILEEINKDLKYSDTSSYFMTIARKIMKRGSKIDCIKTNIY